jgi:ergothioneine biosynthesis protein EgtB
MSTEGLRTMTDVYSTGDGPPSALQFRQADRAGVRAALTASRDAMLELFAAYRAALGDELRVPQRDELNPPLWELGHIGWFEEFWCARNPERARGLAAVPETPRPPPLLAGADELYDSSRVAHATRWQLPLPDAQATLAYLAAVREQTLALLDRIPDDELYFVQLAILHEDMHREAWDYMAQTLALPLERPPPPALPADAGEVALPGGAWMLGSSAGGFAFDNELPAHTVRLAPFAIDAAPVSWARYLPFIAAGGYGRPEFWSENGWRWCQARRQERGEALPRYLRRHGADWEIRRFAGWQVLDAAQPAIHLTYYEAEAWCRWAGRRLPGEAEWEMAAMTRPDTFHWGAVWEWTASAFAPFVGFAAHPYRDYSRPWFDGRPVLRGASPATSERIRHPRYRNYFTAARDDIYAGFRSCAP